MNNALKYVLEAGERYIVGEKSKYEEIIKYKCIDENIIFLSKEKKSSQIIIRAR